MNLFLTMTQPRHIIIAKDFLEDYNCTSTNGILHLSRFYNDNTMVSINIHHNGHNELYELSGFNTMAQKMIDLGMHRIKYYNANGVAQPIGQNAILIEFHGRAEICYRHYNVKVILIVKLDNNTIKIVNQILEIYV